MSLYDPQGFLGFIIQTMTTNVTGDIFLTLLGGFLMFIMVIAGENMPFKLMGAIFTPLILTLMAFNGQFVIVGFFILLYLGILLKPLRWYNA